MFKNHFWSWKTSQKSVFGPQNLCLNVPRPYFGPQCPQIAAPQPKIGPQCPYLAVPPHIIGPQCLQEPGILEILDLKPF